MIKDTTISIRTNSKLKAKAQNVIEANGMSLSAFINSQLLRASKAKTLTLDFSAEKPSEWLSHGQNEQLRQDAQELGQLEFNDLPSEDDWLAIQPPIA